MIALYCLSFLAFIRSNHADTLVDLVNADAVADCSKGTNCLGTDGGLVNEISLLSGPTATEDGQCCYTYRSVHTSADDCRGPGNNPTQSHWTIAPVCPDDSVTATYTVDGVSRTISDDSSICYKGLKMDSGCKDSCDYEICVKYSNLPPGKCCTAESWYGVKAGPAATFGLIDAPSCDCETVPPTADPSKSPTRNPTPSPTPNPTPAPTDDPTSDPTPAPTDDPTRNPTPAPTDNPTRNPTPSPTPFCIPIVEINVNDGCTEANIETGDTNVLWAGIKPYDNPDVFGTLSDVPQDQLAKIVLDHSCGAGEDNTLAGRSERMWQDYDEERLRYPQDVEGKPVDIRHKPLIAVPESVGLLSDNGYWMVIGVLSVYSVVVSMLYCRTRGDGRGKGKRVPSNWDSGDDRQNML